MLVRGARCGLIAGFPVSIVCTPSTVNEYSHTPGGTGPTVALQTPLSSFVITVFGIDWPATLTSLACGARR